jgi:RimJ/RimL family protein N-acetyltransferase
MIVDGAKTRLRPVREDDLPQLTTWANDADVRRWLHHSDREDATVDDARAVYMSADESRLSLAIENAAGALIGIIWLIGIDRTHLRAELAIVIGDKTAWGAGHGTEAMWLLLRHAFEEIGLRRIDLITDADNERGIRSYEKCGFVREGVLRKYRLRHGQPLDMIAMSILREEFEA